MNPVGVIIARTRLNELRASGDIPSGKDNFKMEFSIATLVAFVILVSIFAFGSIAMEEAFDSRFGSAFFATGTFYLVFSILCTLGKILTKAPQGEGVMSAMFSILSWRHMYPEDSFSADMIALCHFAVVALPIFMGAVVASRR